MERKGRELRLVIFIEYVAIHYIDIVTCECDIMLTTTASSLSYNVCKLSIWNVGMVMVKQRGLPHF